MSRSCGAELRDRAQAEHVVERLASPWLRADHVAGDVRHDDGCARRACRVAACCEPALASVRLKIMTSVFLPLTKFLPVRLQGLTDATTSLLGSTLVIFGSLLLAGAGVGCERPKARSAARARAKMQSSLRGKVKCRVCGWSSSEACAVHVRSRALPVSTASGKPFRRFWTPQMIALIRSRSHHRAQLMRKDIRAHNRRHLVARSRSVATRATGLACLRAASTSAPAITTLRALIAAESAGVEVDATAGRQRLARRRDHRVDRDRALSRAQLEAPCSRRVAARVPSGSGSRRPERDACRRSPTALRGIAQRVRRRKSARHALERASATCLSTSARSRAEPPRPALTCADRPCARPCPCS